MTECELALRDCMSALVTSIQKTTSLQSQLKESEEKLKIAKEALTLIEYVDNHGGVNQYRSCAEIAKEALEKLNPNFGNKQKEGNEK